jgi:HEAT repeat protein
MRFDLISFIIGVTVGVAASIVVYRQREVVRRIWASVLDRLRRLRDALSANMETRYQAALLAHFDQMSLTRGLADFDALYVDQVFDPPPIRPTLTPPDPNSLTPIRLSAALRSASRLAVLGDSGSGRTTLLIKFARLHFAKQAREQLGLDRERLPIVLHLAEIDWAAAKDDDPVATLLPAATAHVPRLVATNVGGMVRNRLRGNAVRLLLDGFDELTPGQRARCVQWLGALLTQFPEVPAVITTGSLGYGALQNLGFAPLQLAAWTMPMVDQYAQRWIKIISGGKQDLRVLAHGLHELFGLAASPIDVAFAAAIWRTRTALPASRSAAFEQWIDRAVRGDGSKELLAPDKIKTALAKIAWTILQSSRIDFGFDEIEQAIAGAMITGDAPAKPTEQAATIAHDIVDHSGLLVPFGVDGFAFAHPLLTAYLAAWHAVQSSAAIEAYWDQPEWSRVFDFYAALADPAEFVNRALSTPDDLGRSRLWKVARWTGSANPEAPYRSRVMSEAARALVQPEQFMALRERALDGLLATHDKGLAYLLKRGLSHTDPAVRALGVRGMGALKREPDLPLFIAALNDPSPEVKATALNAIGGLARDGSHAAVEQLIKMVLEQDETGRRLAAEWLAECGEEGYQILREGVNEEDIQVRRAAAYGLAATGLAWARELVQKLMRDDKQWFVRSAAQDALNIMDTRTRQPNADPVIDLSPIVVDQQGWLIEWAAKQGIGIGVGRQAAAALMRALDEGDRPVRLAALQTLRLAGDLSHHDKLRALLYDPDRAVCDAAFVALEAIGQRTGQMIPR